MVNMRTQPYDIRIDRRTKWGNPFRIGPDGTRQEVIELYRSWIVQSTLMNDLHELAGKRLGCHCKPLRCHGDVLANLVNSIGRNSL